MKVFRHWKQHYGLLGSLDLLKTRNFLSGLGNLHRHWVGKPRVLLANRPRAREWSARRINSILHGLPSGDSYLEVGVWSGRTLERIHAATRYGVDPAPRFDLSHLPDDLHFFEGTSDEFFMQLPEDAEFDVVFLDGLHTFQQTYQDLMNALNHTHNGVVLVDDTVPGDEVSAIPDQDVSLARRSQLGMTGTPWHGDVYKLVICIERHLSELDFRTIVGSGNPQTLFWRRSPNVEVAPPTTTEISEIADLSFNDVFFDGIPSLFNPCSEQKALSALFRAIAS
jgi:hypothetical protein